MKLRNILYGFAIIIFLTGIIASIIGESSAIYLPLLYVGVGLLVITIITIIVLLIKDKGHIK